MDDFNSDNEFSPPKLSFNPESKLSFEKFNSDFFRVFETGIGFGYEYFQENGFDYPLKFSSKEGLGIRAPGSNFTIDDARRLVGSRRTIEVFDCQNFESYQLTMKKFAEYYKNPDHFNKYLNLITLEFCQTKLDDYVQAPVVVSELDWIELAWPAERREVQFDENSNVINFNYPKVQKYLLASVKGCYTDFHIDFCGTSVWYHLNSGVKYFWVAPSTEENLKTFERWQKMPNQNDIFLGDILVAPKCQLIRLKAGETLFLPSGWIHAVYTGEDSLVFGGNFLNSFSIKNQIKIIDLERRLRLKKKYKFPYYDKLCNYVVQKYCSMLAIGTHYENSSDLNFNLRKSNALLEPGQIYLTKQEHSGLYMLIDRMESEIGQCGANDKEIAMINIGRKLLNLYDYNKFKSKSSTKPFLNYFLQINKQSRGFSVHIKKPKVSTNSTKYKTIRRVRCKTCEPCTREECKYCVYCLDMKKFGGIGKLKQSCLSRKCLSPQLPKHAECMVCHKKELEFKGQTLPDVNGEHINLHALFECSDCYLIAHPICMYNKYMQYIGNKAPTLNDDLSSSWKCFFCSNNVQVQGRCENENLAEKKDILKLDENHYLSLKDMDFPSSKINLLEKIKRVSESNPNELLIAPLVGFKPASSPIGCITIKKAKFES